MKHRHVIEHLRKIYGPYRQYRLAEFIGKFGRTRAIGALDAIIKRLIPETSSKQEKPCNSLISTK